MNVLFYQPAASNGRTCINNVGVSARRSTSLKLLHLFLNGHGGGVVGENLSHDLLCVAFALQNTNRTNNVDFVGHQSDKINRKYLDKNLFHI